MPSRCCLVFGILHPLAHGFAYPGREPCLSTLTCCRGPRSAFWSRVLASPPGCAISDLSHGSAVFPSDAPPYSHRPRQSPFAQVVKCMLPGPWPVDVGLILFSVIPPQGMGRARRNAEHTSALSARPIWRRDALLGLSGCTVSAAKCICRYRMPYLLQVAAAPG